MEFPFNPLRPDATSACNFIFWPYRLHLPLNPSPHLIHAKCFSHVQFCRDGQGEHKRTEHFHILPSSEQSHKNRGPVKLDFTSSSAFRLHFAPQMSEYFLLLKKENNKCVRTMEAQGRRKYGYVRH